MKFKLVMSAEESWSHSSPYHYPKLDIYWRGCFWRMYATDTLDSVKSEGDSPIVSYVVEHWEEIQSIYKTMILKESL